MNEQKSASSIGRKKNFIVTVCVKVDLTEQFFIRLWKLCDIPHCIKAVLYILVLPQLLDIQQILSLDRIQAQPRLLFIVIEVTTR